MHRSSESVAAIATALAKAQTELSNPEKVLVGTIRHSHQAAPQAFRYAPLSSGLDIIRKTLGGQQGDVTGRQLRQPQRPNNPSAGKPMQVGSGRLAAPLRSCLSGCS
jgi:hypothetical protein